LKTKKSFQPGSFCFSILPPIDGLLCRINNIETRQGIHHPTINYLFIEFFSTNKCIGTMSTILQIANADRNLASLVKGINAADLEETLNGFGPFTILAPVNMAFGNLLAPDTFEDLVRQSAKNSKLSDILSYHIIAGKKLLRDFRNGQKLRTINGKELTILVKDDDVYVNGAKILSRDRQGSNGVIHSINAVNLPLEETVA